jgi:hypothetical protein
MRLNEGDDFMTASPDALWRSLTGQMPITGKKWHRSPADH